MRLETRIRQLEAVFDRGADRRVEQAPLDAPYPEAYSHTTQSPEPEESNFGCATHPLGSLIGASRAGVSCTGEEVMRRPTVVLLVACLVSGCATSPKTVWLRPTTLVPLGEGPVKIRGR